MLETLTGIVRGARAQFLEQSFWDQILPTKTTEEDQLIGQTLLGVEASRQADIAGMCANYCRGLKDLSDGNTPNSLEFSYALETLGIAPSQIRSHLKVLKQYLLSRAAVADYGKRMPLLERAELEAHDELRKAYACLPDLRRKALAAGSARVELHHEKLSVDSMLREHPWLEGVDE